MSRMFLLAFNWLCGFVDKLLFFLMNIYESFVYGPLQRHLSPVIVHIPRNVTVVGRTVAFFTANRVTLGRTLLVLPIAICLKCQYHIFGFILIILHDFLDHVDGIVAKVHRRHYGMVDSPILGSFLDAFCDKVVNVFTLWSILLLADSHLFSLPQLLIFTSVCGTVIGYETILGIIRVQDYFYAVYVISKKEKDYKTSGIQASMEGKTKEKLESMGLAFLILALRYSNPMDSWLCICGCICLIVSIRFAHKSLVYKLMARKRNAAVVYARRGHEAPMFLSGIMPHVSSAPDLQTLRPHTDSESSTDDNTMVDKVYTVGCFDLLHQGHVKLFKNMRHMGREVIVGVHNDESYFKLKKKIPIDNTEKRMENVKKYADQVFAVSSTDPSPYLRCCVHLKPGQTALYVRGDDMPQFPGRSLCEQLMSIQLLPYTPGVSSTALRAKLLSGNHPTQEDENTEDINTLVDSDTKANPNIDSMLF